MAKFRVGDKEEWIEKYYALHTGLIDKETLELAYDILYFRVPDEFYKLPEFKSAQEALDWLDQES